MTEIIKKFYRISSTTICLTLELCKTLVELTAGSNHLEDLSSSKMSKSMIFELLYSYILYYQLSSILFFTTKVLLSRFFVPGFYFCIIDPTVKVTKRVRYNAGNTTELFLWSPEAVITRCSSGCHQWLIMDLNLDYKPNTLTAAHETIIR